MDYITLTADFEDPGTPAVLPTMGRNAYAFLNNLTPEALLQMQSAFAEGDLADAGLGDVEFGSDGAGAGGIDGEALVDEEVAGGGGKGRTKYEGRRTNGGGHGETPGEKGFGVRGSGNERCRRSVGRAID